MVGLCCLCISGIFKSQIIAHPIIFALLGYALVVAYYGLCNSSLNQGQTLGKTLLKVKVIHSSGDYLAVSQSLFRAAILYAPICLLSACQFIGSALISTLLSFIFVVIYAWTLYLYIFNKNNRRSLHDYAANSIVVNADVAIQPIQVLWKGHYIFISIITALCIFYFVADHQSLKRLSSGSAHLNELQSKQPNIIKILNVSQDISDQDHKASMHMYTLYVNKYALLYTPDFVQSFAQHLDQADPNILSEDNMVWVGLQAGYQFGLATKMDINMYQITKTDSGIEVTEQISTINSTF